MGFFDTDGERMAKEIAKLIESEEYKTAEANLQTYNRDIDIQKQRTLRNKLEKAKSLSQFRKAVSGFNHKQAREALVALAGQVPSSEYASLEARLKAIEDTDIISHLNSISYEPQREEAIRKFLESNPEGKERKEVIEYVLAKKFVAIEDDFKNARQEFSKVFNDLLNLNNLLERYQNDGTSLGDVVDIAKFTAMITEYLSGDLVKATKPYDEKVPGKIVKFTGTSFGASMGYNNNYLTYRNNHLSVGTIGKLFWIDVQNDIWVLFEGDVNENWKNLMESNNSLKEYHSKHPNQRAAYFKRKELTVVELYNEIEKNTVRKELARMNDLFAQGYSKPKADQEQVEVKTVKPGINELVSQDFPSRVK